MAPKKNTDTSGGGEGLQGGRGAPPPEGQGAYPQQPCVGGEGIVQGRGIPPAQPQYGGIPFGQQGVGGVPSVGSPSGPPVSEQHQARISVSSQSPPPPLESASLSLVKPITADPNIILANFSQARDAGPLPAVPPCQDETPILLFLQDSNQALSEPPMLELNPPPSSETLGEGLENMSSTPFFEPLPVTEFVSRLLNRNATQRPLTDTDGVKNAYQNDDYAKEFGIRISGQMTEVEARILPPPRKMVNGGTVNNWICINFSRDVPENAARAFCRELALMCQISGMSFRIDPVLPPMQARPDQVERCLKTRYRETLTRLQGRELDLLIVILPENNGPLYGELKRICETDLGVVSQCCLKNTVFKMSKHDMANIALKINVKVGGRNTVLIDAISRRIHEVCDEPTIIFGADVTHPHPGEDSRPSIAAVVASQDWPEVTKYAGLVSAQAHRQEIIQDLYTVRNDPQTGVKPGGMIRDLLKSFRQATGLVPSRIIFYRDGVGEGQFNQVLLHELDAIRKACASLQANYQPKVTFVVVQKRHHTRLFASNHADRRSIDRSGNILPGTVVDSKICHPTEFDFYLCSHAGIQGTSRPAHYHVLWDENNFTADGLQSLTNNLCYTYARCTRSVSIVPPAYYAHLAAFRARFYMEPEVSDNEAGGGVRATRVQVPAPGGNGAVRALPELKDNVKKVMFYC